MIVNRLTISLLLSLNILTIYNKQKKEFLIITIIVLYFSKETNFLFIVSYIVRYLKDLEYFEI